MCESGFVWGCVNLWLKREGRRDWEVGIIYGVRMNHMITLESIEFSFFTCIIHNITLRFGCTNIIFADCLHYTKEILQ